MNTDLTLTVTEIQRFCMHDGPGIRTTVFLKGCPLRCKWCHNPETQRSIPELLFYPSKCIGCGSCITRCPARVHTGEQGPAANRENCIRCGECAVECPAGALELCGRQMSAADILAIAEKDRVFYGDTGGVTLSGGEPLAHKEAAVALLKACKENGLSTAVETCGYVLPETLCAAIPYTDLFLWDLKDTNDTRHRQYTGVSNQTILDNLQLADAHGARIRLRCILVNGVNSDPEHYTRVADIAETLSGLEGVEILPYHAYAGTKAVFLGYEDNGNPDWIPPAAEISRMKQVLKDRGIPVL